MQDAAPTERIAKLLALALDQHGTPEGDLARSRAEALLERFGIEESEITGADDADRVVVKEIKLPSAHWRRALVTALCRLCCVHMAFGRGIGIVAGRSRDIKLSLFLVDSVIRQMEFEFQDWLDGLRFGASRTRRRVWRESYVAGLHARTLEILRQREATDETTGSSTALVLVDRDSAAKSALRSQFEVSSKKTRNLDAYSGHGYQAGRSASLRGGLGASDRQRIGGPR